MNTIQEIPEQDRKSSTTSTVVASSSTSKPLPSLPLKSVNISSGQNSINFLSLQTLSTHQSSSEIHKHSLMCKMKHIFKDSAMHQPRQKPAKKAMKENLSITEGEERTHCRFTRSPRHLITVILMISFGTSMAIVFVLVGLGEIGKSKNAIQESDTVSSISPSSVSIKSQSFPVIDTRSVFLPSL